MPDIPLLASTDAGLGSVDLERVRPEAAAMELAPGEFALKQQVLPLRVEDGKLYVAIGGLQSLSAADDLGILTGLEIVPQIADAALVRERIEEFFLERMLAGVGGDDSAIVELDDSTDLADLTKMAAETAVVQMANLVFAQAVRDGASDIHIEPFEKELKIRYRIDGMLQDMMRPPKRMHAALISRLKILGEMNIAERRLPQDGRIKITIAGRAVDVRVSIVPTVFGERAVMRLLDKGTAMLGLDELGMQPDTLEKFRKIIGLPYGIILATGPTGSGKSTSLYASLQEIWSPETNILTIEDPVEYQVSGISQVQARPAIGLTFASALRSFLRQDPDVIMVGEIRDKETAEIAINASLTGHLVFSTLHTNDSSGSITRLIDMGVEPFLVSSSLVGVIAQRLIRRVCSNCALEFTPNDDELSALGLTRDTIPAGSVFKRGAGCEKCTNSGYKGRVGLYELLTVDETIRHLAVERAPASEIKKHAVQVQGMRTLVQEGRIAVLGGRTTPEEVLRVAAREDL